ncbi:MarR family transcriptional regulator [Microbacterium sp. 2C]|jgi:DNA-binding MarR family transcriptional regulator|uniref:MarR family winged helix-turn-helix transcriptional regulator n=1 Tax=Microbacterium paulum TaxID=2707006 RepID=UPI0018C1FBE0|nr:MarR family transcriptional regulator [Microbacterium paulum]MBG0717285.1 MarR family transcriptional regulator [Microbacterium paulum]
METSVSSGEVLDSLARFRTSDAQMHQRVRATTTLGENEMRILSYLLRQHRDGNVVKPSEISRHLAISSASTTALLDRLERQGSVERISHPTDRRSILIAPTARAAGDVADIVDAFETRVTEAIEALGDEGRASVLRFLDAVADAADDIATSER